MLNLVCLDRDGVINEDKNYYLGSSPEWKKQIEILPGVTEGIKRLNSTSNLEVFILTNQSGIALIDFPLLTEERAQEVNDYIIHLLQIQKAFVRKDFICPFLDKKYSDLERKAGHEVDLKYFRENPEDLKPNIGMILKSARTLGKSLEECNVFFIGDRLSDVQTGLNANGHGILVPSSKTFELKDMEKVKSMKGKIYVARNFLDAVNYVLSNLVTI